MRFRECFFFSTENLNFPWLYFGMYFDWFLRGESYNRARNNILRIFFDRFRGRYRFVFLKVEI